MVTKITRMFIEGFALFKIIQGFSEDKQFSKIFSSLLRLQNSFRRLFGRTNDKNEPAISFHSKTQVTPPFNFSSGVKLIKNCSHTREEKGQNRKIRKRKIESDHFLPLMRAAAPATFQFSPLCAEFPTNRVASFFRFICEHYNNDRGRNGKRSRKV